MRVKEMLDTYQRDAAVDSAMLARTIEMLEECANVCTQCADACLSEGGLSPDLATCIRLDLDCADICLTTARVMSRQMQHDTEVLKTLLTACAAICTSCGDECATHADHMDHCRICAETCRSCESACREFLGSFTR